MGNVQMRNPVLQMARPALAATALVAAAGVAQAVPLSYTNFTPINGWEKFASAVRAPGGALDTNGIVHLRGVLDQATGSNTQMFTLPVEFRPNKVVYLPIGVSNGHTGRITVYPTGEVYVNAFGNQSNAQDFTGLDGIIYSLN